MDQHTIDFILIVLGFFIGVGSRLKGVFVFLQVALLIAKMAKWYYETHPHGKKQAKHIKFDEKLDKLYHEKLKKHDPHRQYYMPPIDPEYKSLIGMEVTGHENEAEKNN